jgi:predicted ATP-binding protein involved in virulence
MEDHVSSEALAAVSIVSDEDGEDNTITLVGDVENRVVFLTVSMKAACCIHTYTKVYIFKTDIEKDGVLFSIQM